jgi:hypothetical protein
MRRSFPTAPTATAPPAASRSFRSTRGGVRVLALGLAAVMGACGGGESGAEEPSPGSGLDAPDRMLALEPVETYRVGGFDAPEWATFGEVSALRFDAAGRLYVLDGQAGQVTVVNPDGTLAGTVGEPGEGPGELSSPLGLAVLPDGRVAVFDTSKRGFVVYGPDGAHMETHPVDLQTLGFPGREVRAHPDGGIVAGIGGRIMMRGSGGVTSGPEGRPVAYFPLTPDSEGRVVYEAWDLPPVEETEERTMEVGGGGSFSMRMPTERAFEPVLEVEVLPDGRLAVADSVGYRIKLVELDGTVGGALERPVQPTPVTEEIEEAERERRVAELQEGGGPQMTIRVQGGGSVGEVDRGAVRRMLEERVASMTFAEVIPVIEEVAVDGYGRIWVQRSGGEPGETGPTDLITPDGLYLGSIPADGVRIPRTFGPGGLMARVETDDFDVATVVVERLPEGEEGGPTP